MKGMTEQEFQKEWNDRYFHTAENPLLYSVARRIFTQKEIDKTLLYIIQLAGDSKRVTSEVKKKVKPPPLGAGVVGKKFLDSLRAVKDSMPLPIIFGSIRADELERAIDDGLARDRIYRADLTGGREKPFIESTKFEDFIVGLAIKDAFPRTKPTKHLQSFFACLLADHFRHETGKPNFAFVGLIIQGIFNEKKTRTRTLRQRCTDFTAAFPMWPDVAQDIYTESKHLKLAL